ncbi:protein lin-54 homolog isoform X2 [Littorina saxatilis]|uniref:protein lin-54 homolog isoform X2 n=1 Tax=Littorina saxatilis TaxID=31220 RepID=UPI0038B5408C
MPAERIGIKKGDNVNAPPMSAVVLQATSTGAAAATNNTAASAHTVSASPTNQPLYTNKVITTVGKSVVHRLVNSNADVILQSPSNLVSSTDGTSNSTRSITVDASPRGGATITSQMQTSSPITVVTNDRAALKRPLPGGPGSSGVVTKVIITRNPSSSQPHAMPIHVSGLPSGAATSAAVSGAVSIISQAAASLTPTKTVTISSQGIVSPGKTVLATLPGSPTKVSIPVNKVPISPAKTPTKITMIPVSIPKSPQQRLTVPGSSSITVLPRTFSDGTNSTGTKPATITMSPSKVIIKQAPSKAVPLKTQAQIAPAGQGPVTLQLPMTVGGGSVQQVQVPGSKFHYVRLVSPTTQSSVAISKPINTVAKVIPAARHIAPATSAGTNQVKITLPVSQTLQLSSKGGTVVGGQTQTVQRIILPATQSPLPVTSSGMTTPTSLASIRPNLQGASTPNLTQLPAGTTLLTPTTSLQGLQGFALVPAQYVTQLQLNKPAVASSTTQSVSVQQQTQAQVQTTQASQQQKAQDYVPIASNDPALTNYTIQRNSVNGTFEATGARPRKPCNCTKSQCLKLYCDCFANGEFCHNCNCNNCANNLEHEEERSRAIKSCLDRNPMAFHPKIGFTHVIGKSKDNDGNRRHNKGCNCKRSGCLKNYCECYEAKIMCSSFCKCIGCKNFEESSERKTLMHLADAAEVRVQQQTAAKTKLSSQISGIPSKPPASSASGERLPFTLITADVAEATSACLLAQAEEAERLKMPPVVQERMVIEEFGRCLLQIIESANRTKAAAASDL